MRMVIYAAIDTACGLLQSHGMRWPLRAPSSASSHVAAARQASGVAARPGTGHAHIPHAASSNSSNSISSGNTPGPMSSVPRHSPNGLQTGDRRALKEVTAVSSAAPPASVRAVPPPTPFTTPPSSAPTPQHHVGRYHGASHMQPSTQPVQPQQAPQQQGAYQGWSTQQLTQQQQAAPRAPSTHEQHQELSPSQGSQQQQWSPQNQLRQPRVSQQRPPQQQNQRQPAQDPSNHAQQQPQQPSQQQTLPQQPPQQQHQQQPQQQHQQHHSQLQHEQQWQQQQQVKAQRPPAQPLPLAEQNGTFGHAASQQPAARAAATPAAPSNGLQSGPAGPESQAPKRPAATRRTSRKTASPAAAGADGSAPMHSSSSDRIPPANAVADAAAAPAPKPRGRRPGSTKPRSARTSSSQAASESPTSSADAPATPPVPARSGTPAAPGNAGARSASADSSLVPSTSSSSTASPSAPDATPATISKRGRPAAGSGNSSAPKPPRSKGTRLPAAKKASQSPAAPSTAVMLVPSEPAAPPALILQQPAALQQQGQATSTPAPWDAAPEQAPVQQAAPQAPLQQLQGPPDINPANQLNTQRAAPAPALAQQYSQSNGYSQCRYGAAMSQSVPLQLQQHTNNGRTQARQPAGASAATSSIPLEHASHIMNSNMPFNAKVEALQGVLTQAGTAPGTYTMQQLPQNGAAEPAQASSPAAAWQQFYKTQPHTPTTPGMNTLPARPRPPSSSMSPALLPAGQAATAATAAAAPEPVPIAPLSAPPPDVCIVDSIERAKAVAARAMEVAQQGLVRPDGKREDAKDIVFACDTEVAGIDIKEESPVGHGSVICFSFYCGPWANFNPDPQGPPQPRVWVDLMPFAQQQAQEMAQRHEQDREAAVAVHTAALERVAAADEALATAKQQLAEALERWQQQQQPQEQQQQQPLQEQQQQQQEEQRQQEEQGVQQQETTASKPLSKAYLKGVASRLKREAAAAEAAGIKAAGSKAAGSRTVASKAAASKPPALPEHAAVAAAEQEAKAAAAAAAAAAAEAERLHSMPTAPTVREPSVQDILSNPEAAGILAAFQPFFESDTVQKVWHNYGFDRHVLSNMNVSLGGFGGDTMHMARLHDASRKLSGGYSLESLSSDQKLMRSIEADLGDAAALPKRGMKERFGVKKTKRDGTLGKVVTIAPMHVLQTGEQFRWEWIDYSALDAKATWNLHRALKKALKSTRAQVEVGLERTLRKGLKQQHGAAGDSVYCSEGEQYTMWRVYEEYWRPFGELLTDMEAEGVKVNREHLAAAEQQAKKDQELAMAFFKKWAEHMVPDAKYMNIGSGLQIRQLLFPDAVKGGVRTFKALNPDYEQGIAEGWKPKPRRHIEFDLYGVWGKDEPGRLKSEVMTDKGSPAVSTAVLRALAGKPGAARKAYDALDDVPPAEHPVPIFEEDDELLFAANAAAAAGDEDSVDGAAGVALGSLDEAEAADASATGAVAVSNGHSKAKRNFEEASAEAAAKGYGKMYAVMDTHEEGLHACAALEALCEVSAIDKLLSAFIVPLQGDDISTPHDHRVHCSLNLNTETGRLSARRPNLQNQPAHEKDRYKVRKAFTADVAAGKTLVVADYGQLELRLLAHMANCKSMLTAFELGGDFHSRTALGMYDHIQDAINKGDCLLEWGGGETGDEPSPVPLLKDMFGSERRKAKVLNFSIAYGKTARGLSKDWNVSLGEAEETVKRWYADRPEVLHWQERTRTFAGQHGYVNTLLGRRRNLAPGIHSKDRFVKLRAERAAINTPIQGSAADVASAAMLAIARDEWLKEHGWKLLLQVHDEVMLEGPKESSEEARAQVIAAMANPWDNLLGFKGKPLLVDLVVDCKIADTWYEAK